MKLFETVIRAIDLTSAFRFRHFCMDMRNRRSSGCHWKSIVPGSPLLTSLRSRDDRAGIAINVYTGQIRVWTLRSLTRFPPKWCKRCRIDQTVAAVMNVSFDLTESFPSIRD